MRVFRKPDYLEVRKHATKSASKSTEYVQAAVTYTADKHIHTYIHTQVRM